MLKRIWYSDYFLPDLLSIILFAIFCVIIGESTLFLFLAYTALFVNVLIYSYYVYKAFKFDIALHNKIIKKLRNLSKQFKWL